MRILHIHQDFPDGRPYPNTKAVANLIAESEKYQCDIDHLVLSINRTSNPFKISIKRFERGISLVYWALPVRFVYKPMIYFWAAVSAFLLREYDFDVIHGHKLTTEGVFSYLLACTRQVPYYISVRGGSDIHNINRIPDCRKIFKLAFKNAQKVFWVSLWAKAEVQRILDYHHPASVTLPNICEIQIANRQHRQPRNGYCIILSYHQLHRKGVLPLLRALALLKKQGVIITLDIIGMGEVKYQTMIAKQIAQLGLQQQVKMIGQLSHAEILTYLQTSKGMLLPAINETFGMAYIEALACSTPIIYMANTGIDGYIDDLAVGVKITEQSDQAISQAILDIENNFSIYQASLEKINNSGLLSKFTGRAIAQTYISSLLTA